MGGTDTLRQLFVLLIGLGMRESSGQYCEGRDRSASNVTAEAAAVPEQLEHQDCE